MSSLKFSQETQTFAGSCNMMVCHRIDIENMKNILICMHRHCRSLAKGVHKCSGEELSNAHGDYVECMLRSLNLAHLPIYNGVRLTESWCCCLLLFSCMYIDLFRDHFRWSEQQEKEQTAASIISYEWKINAKHVVVIDIYT